MQITINAESIRFKRFTKFNGGCYRFYFSSRPGPVFEMFSRFAGSSLQKQNNTQVLRRTTYEYKRNSSKNCFASFCCLFSPFPICGFYLNRKWMGKGGLYCVALTIDLGSSCCRCAPPVMLSLKKNFTRPSAYMVLNFIWIFQSSRLSFGLLCQTGSVWHFPPN